MVLSAVAATGCATLSESSRAPARLDARCTYYGDDRGLTAITIGARVEHPVSRSLTFMGQVLADHFEAKQNKRVSKDMGDQLTGHVHDAVDSVSRASVTIAGGDRLKKVRLEGSAGGSFRTFVEQLPLRLDGLARLSYETDYLSFFSGLQGTIELSRRNTILSALLGYGHDQSNPIVLPPGESGRWPAPRKRLSAGITASQVLSTTIMASAGLSGVWQHGILESPYRRALVVTSLFPERLPSDRLRYTAFLGMSWFLGWGTALHVRQGAYLDSWSVGAVIPEIQLNTELGEDWLLSLHHRTYLQSRAAFYEKQYSDLVELRTGDARLGRLREHLQGADVSWIVLGKRGAPTNLIAVGGYRVSWLRYAQLERSLTAHMVSIGLSADY